MHRRFGASFYALDNGISYTGKRIDLGLEEWFYSWYSSRKNHMKTAILFYVLSIILVVCPGYFKVDKGILTMGETTYLYCEERMINWFDEHDWYEKTPTEYTEIEFVEIIDEEKHTFEERLRVYDISSSLLVRDIPSIEGSAVLARLHNDDMVLWKGQIVFAETNRHVEAWVKIATENGIEGWSRLNYLRPEQYSNKEYLVTEVN